MNVECTWWRYVEPFIYVPRDDAPHVRTPIMENLATGERLPSNKLPVGALWAATGDGYWLGPDGLSICCRLPGNHTWFIDGQASNCTMKNDDVHRCWVRHGTVGDKLHIDKNGVTCAAGAGSIAIPGYHGFLHDGQLTDVP